MHTALSSYLVAYHGQGISYRVKTPPGLLPFPAILPRMTPAPGWHMAHSSCGFSHTEQAETALYPFNYIPSFAAGIAFIILFSLVTGTFFPSIHPGLPSDTLPNRCSYRPSAPREDMVVVPDNSDRWCRRNYWLGW